MNKKFRILSLLLCFTMVLALTACGSKEEEKQEETTSTVEISSSLEEFDTTTLSGESVTQDIFKDYDMTVVNVWSTTCGYCIDEMPALEKLANQMPSNVNFISICLDASTNTDVANKIVADNGVTFPVLSDSESLIKNFLMSVTATPTTYFVNSKGEMLGEPKLGTFNTTDMDEMTRLYMDEVLAHLSLI